MFQSRPTTTTKTPCPILGRRIGVAVWLPGVLLFSGCFSTTALQDNLPDWNPVPTVWGNSTPEENPAKVRQYQSSRQQVVEGFESSLAANEYLLGTQESVGRNAIKHDPSELESKELHRQMFRQGSSKWQNSGQIPLIPTAPNYQQLQKENWEREYQRTIEENERLALLNRRPAGQNWGRGNGKDSGYQRNMPVRDAGSNPIKSEFSQPPAGKQKVASPNEKKRSRLFPEAASPFVSETQRVKTFLPAVLPFKR